MKTDNLTKMRSHCDDLTKDGKELSVTWEGGNDSGWFSLHLDGDEITAPSPIEEAILRYIEDQVDYGSFAGDFSTDGEVVYDRMQKCFTGEDNYSQTEEANLECNIELKIPESIWFDRVTLWATADGDDPVGTTIAIHLANGPYPAAFDLIEPDILEAMDEQFLKALTDIEDFAGMWETFDIARRSFLNKDGMLVYKIENFTYSFSKYEVEGITIDMGTDQYAEQTLLKFT